MEINKTMNILEKAREIIYDRAEEKERQYGPMSLTNREAAKIASVLCKKEISVTDVYYVIMSLKLARQANSHKEDNLLDLVAYTAGLNNYMEGIIIEQNDICHENK